MHGYLTNIIRWMLRLVLPLTLIGMMFIPALGTRQLEQSVVLRSQFPDEQPLLIGTGENQSTYLLWPSVLKNPRLVTVHSSADTAPRIEQSRVGFVLWVCFLLLCAIGTWWVWRPRPTPPNNSFKPKPLRGSA